MASPWIRLGGDAMEDKNITDIIEKIRIELFKWLRVQTIIDKITEFILKTIRMLYNKRGERYTKWRNKKVQSESIHYFS